MTKIEKLPISAILNEMIHFVEKWRFSTFVISVCFNQHSMIETAIESRKSKYLKKLVFQFFRPQIPQKSAEFEEVCI